MAVAQMPSGPGVNFFAPIGVQNGLGSAARGYLAALRHAQLDVCLVPVHELFVHQQAVGRRWSRQKPRHPISIVHVNADSVHRFLHYHGRDFRRARFRIALWAWELAAFPEAWTSELRHFDEVWVPSRFCQRAVQAITNKPVLLMPHVVEPVPPPDPDRHPPARHPPGRRDVTFLYVFDALGTIERKNPHCLVEAFIAEFPPTEAVELVLKVANLSEAPAFSAYLDATTARDHRIRVIRHPMSAADLQALVGRSDCYVSPHRSEGFGLTVAEAMALGVPVIATDYGGTTDFVTDDTGFPLDYRLSALDRDCGEYKRGAIWAEPSREHLQRLLRQVAADPGQARRKAAAARAAMHRSHSAAAIGEAIGQRLRAIAGSMGA